jgi:hypothetical protein
MNLIETNMRQKNVGKENIIIEIAKDTKNLEWKNIGKKRIVWNKKFINALNKVHKNKYNYSKVNYVTSNQKIIVICPVHGEFHQKASHHLNGHGCSKCVNVISKPEIMYLNYYKIRKSNRQKYINGFRVDGYDSKTNTIYEFLGDYWHGNPIRHNPNEINKKCHKTFGELYKNTFKKFEKLKMLGYKILYIWETDWNKFKKNIDKTPNLNKA